MALDLLDELGSVIDALQGSAIDYAVCGGIALAIHGFARATEDIDLLVPAAQVDAALACVKPLGFDVPSRRMVFRRGKPDEHHMQRISKLDPRTNALLALDLLLVGPAHVDVWQGRVRLDWGKRTIWVVSRDGLVTMKRAAGRPQDLVDISRLDGQDDEAE